MKPLLCIAAAALALGQPVLAATNPWFGTWKLNRDKSTLTGSTITAVKIPNGYRFDFGAVKYDVIEDGQDHEILPHRTVSLKPTGKDEWLRVVKLDGKEISRSTMSLSSDGNTLTQRTTGTRADGTTYSAGDTEVRVGAGEGLAGTFKEVKEQSSVSSVMIYSDGGGGKIKAAYPGSKSTELISFDGKPVVEQGPRTMPGATNSYTKVSDTEFKYTMTVNGKKYVEGTSTVSTDGKVIKMISWLTTKPAEKEIEIYEKQ